MPAESVRPPEPVGPPGTGLSEFQRNFNPRDVTAEDLDGYVDGLRHDKIIWIGVTSDPTRNDENGVKVVVKVRGARWNTRLKADKYHEAKGWLKTTFFKTRSGEWRLIEDGCQLESSVSLPTEDGLGFCVQFHYPAGCRDRAAYMAPVVSREPRSPKRRYVKRKQPPTPPKINIRLTSVPREKVGNKITPKDEDEESPSKNSHAV